MFSFTTTWPYVLLMMTRDPRYVLWVIEYNVGRVVGGAMQWMSSSSPGRSQVMKPFA